MTATLRRFRPRLEGLEERAVLASIAIIWDGPPAASIAFTWDGSNLPGAKTWTATDANGKTGWRGNGQLMTTYPGDPARALSSGDSATFGAGAINNCLDNVSVTIRSLNGWASGRTLTIDAGVMLTLAGNASTWSAGTLAFGSATSKLFIDQSGTGVNTLTVSGGAIDGGASNAPLVLHNANTALVITGTVTKFSPTLYVGFDAALSSPTFGGTVTVNASLNSITTDLGGANWVNTGTVTLQNKRLAAGTPRADLTNGGTLTNNGTVNINPGPFVGGGEQKSDFVFVNQHATGDTTHDVLFSMQTGARLVTTKTATFGSETGVSVYVNGAWLNIFNDASFLGVSGKTYVTGAGCATRRRQSTAGAWASLKNFIQDTGVFDVNYDYTSSNPSYCQLRLFGICAFRGNMTVRMHVSGDDNTLYYDNLKVGDGTTAGSLAISPQGGFAPTLDVITAHARSVAGYTLINTAAGTLVGDSAWGSLTESGPHKDSWQWDVNPVSIKSR